MQETTATAKDLDPTLDDEDGDENGSQGEESKVEEPTPQCCYICKKLGSGPNQDKPLKSCSQCHNIFYCSQECQKQDWKRHKVECISAEAYIKKQMEAKTLCYNDFESIRKLGDGNFTKVFQVQHNKFKNQFFALKICEIQKVSSMKRENDILMEKHSLNKVKEHFAKQMPTVKIFATFKDHMNLYFLTEMFRPRFEVWEHCRTFGVLQDDIARYSFLKICECVKKIHSLDIIHRDLKPENMFFTNETLDQIKLIDLGSSDDLSKPEMRCTFDDDSRRGQHKYFVGTSQYMPPECAHNKPTTRASDIWSLGCILYQLYTGLPPFRGASDYLIFRLSCEANLLKLDEYPESIMPQEAKVLIKKMIQIKQEDRISIQEVMDDALFDQVRDNKQCPKMDQTHTIMKEIITDILKRGNVHRFSGRQEFDSNFQKIKEKFDMEDEYWSQKVQHLYEHALMFVFEIDPQNDKLEAIKLEVQNMSKAAQERNQQKHKKVKKMPQTKKFGEDEGPKEEIQDDEVTSESSNDNQDQDNVNNEPEDEFSSMGCKFNPESFKKLKPKDEDSKSKEDQQEQVENK